MSEPVLALTKIRDVLLSAVALALKVRDGPLQMKLAEALLVASELQIEVATLRDENRRLRDQAGVCSGSTQASQGSSPDFSPSGNENH